MKTGDATGDERGDRRPVHLEDLRREFRQVGIGPAILEEVREVVRGVVRGYDPVVYGQEASWELALEDLVQELGVDVLVGQGQLQYAMTVAGDRLHFRRLVARQVRYLLARRRRRTIVDNLLDRAKRRVNEPPFRLIAGRSEWSYTLKNKDVSPGRVSQDQTTTLAYGLSDLPVARTRARRRAPAVYSEKTLERMLERVAGGVGCAVRVSDLDRILQLVLTPWVPRFLKEGAGALSRAEAPGLSPEQRSIADQEARHIVAACSSDHQEVLRLKLEGASDREVAEHLGLSRPTASKRKREVLVLVGRGMEGLDAELRPAVMEAVGEELERGREEGHDGNG